MSQDAIQCDLVLLSWNHLEETQPCLESLFKYTSVPSRLFIVDNGSEAPVREFLGKVKPQGAIREVTLLQNETNEGFPRGMNRGIDASSAPFVCLLNNDLRFTPGWLEQMLIVASAEESIGVVNPSSDNLGNHVPSNMTREAYAKILHQKEGQFTEVGMCIGFCFLIKRVLIDKIGGLTTEIDRIFFEDEDYSMAAVNAGFRCVVAESAYVAHAEHKTVKPGPERESLFNKNKAWCENKWGKRTRMVWPRFDVPELGSPELKEWLNHLVEWARRRNHVYVYAPMPKGADKKKIFESVGMTPHADVVWKPIPPGMAKLVAAGYVLKRRKKRFDFVVSPTPKWGGFLNRLRWLHGADVVSQNDKEELINRWKTKSRSPLSF